MNCLERLVHVVRMFCYNMLLLDEWIYLCLYNVLIYLSALKTLMQKQCEKKNNNITLHKRIVEIYVNNCFIYLFSALFLIFHALYFVVQNFKIMFLSYFHFYCSFLCLKNEKRHFLSTFFFCKIWNKEQIFILHSVQVTKKKKKKKRKINERARTQRPELWKNDYFILCQANKNKYALQACMLCVNFMA